MRCQLVLYILGLVGIIITASSWQRYHAEVVTIEANPIIRTEEFKQNQYLRGRLNFLPGDTLRVTRILESIDDASKVNSTLLETHGPITTKYIYLILHNISSVPAPKVWSLTTAQYMTDFFNSAGYRVVNTQVNIEYISQLDTSGQTEVLYVQNTLYTIDSSSEYVNLDEIVAGPFYNKKDRQKYVDVLKRVDPVGYGNLMDTSIPENLGEFDFTQRISSINDEGNNNSAVYLFIISLGGFLLFCSGCTCIVWLGFLGWYTLSGLKPMDEEFDEDESTFGNDSTEHCRDIDDEDSCVQNNADEKEFRAGTNNLRLRGRLT